MRRAKLEPVIAELREGRRFDARPTQSDVQRFMAHLLVTGEPYTWSDITTSRPSPTSIPVILKRFSIPDRFRGDITSRAPCPICSPTTPKYENGYLVWDPNDLLVRAIGHDCGKDFFEGQGFEEAVSEYDAEEAELEARAFLNSTYGDLSSLLVQAWFTRLKLSSLLKVRDSFVAAITKKAAERMSKADVGNGALTIEKESTARDAQGHRLVERKVVANAKGLRLIRGGERELEKLQNAARDAGEILILSHDERVEALAGLTRHDAIDWEKRLRALNRANTEGDLTIAELERLLTRENLIEIGKWGRDLHCPTPFWVGQVPGSSLYAGRGLKPANYAGVRPIYGV